VVRDNNVAVRRISSLVNMAFDVFRLTNGGGVAVLPTLLFYNNLFQFYSSGPTFDAVNGWGINVPSQAIGNLVLKGNVASSQAVALSNFFKTRFTGTVTNTLPTGGAPSSGSPWIENINIASI